MTVTCCSLLLYPGRRLCCGLRLCRLLALLCCGSSSQYDVQGNGLRTTELIISTASVAVTEAAADGGPTAVPFITTTASAIVAKHFFSFAAIISTADRCSSSFGPFNTISCGEISSLHVVTIVSSAGSVNRFTAAAPAAVCSARFVREQRTAPEGQVRVGQLHLHNGLVYTGAVTVSRLGLGFRSKPAAQT